MKFYKRLEKKLSLFYDKIQFSLRNRKLTIELKSKFIIKKLHGQYEN